MSESGTPSPLERELAYYKQQVDTLAGENLKLDYVISGLRHELKQKRQGFALLSHLHESIGAHKEMASIFGAVLPAVNAMAAMDRTVLFTPTGEAEGRGFRASQWVGYQEDQAAVLRSTTLELSPSVVAGTERLLVNRAAARLPLTDRLAETLGIPFYVGVPVLVDGRTVALLIGGRMLESKPLYPALDQGDLDTFVAIAGLVSASIRNMRVGVLEELDRLKTEFFANLSHEFRTPITLTLGPLEQLLNGRYGALGDDACEQLRMMRRNQERLLSLVTQILDLAKLEAGRMQLRAAHTPNVNRVIAELSAQFESVAHHRGLELRLSLSPAADGSPLYVDREKLERLLWNLLSNALKFTKHGRVDVATGTRDGVFHLIVTDTGVGIRDDQLPHIFDRFHQADGSESREFAGTGIGLSLVREIARLHGGDVSVSSRYGAGTTFTVSLPLGRAHLDPASVVEATGESDERVTGPRLTGEFVFVAEGSSDMAGTQDVEQANVKTESAFDATRPTVLYAEDNPDLRRHVSRLLEHGYNVFLAADGLDALEKVKRYRPDLVLSDHMMPRMTGRDLLRAMREDPTLRATPVVFLTARAGTEARVESLEAGADDYVTKPFNEGELLARVRNVLRARGQERALAELNTRLAARVEEQLAELVRGGELQRFLPRTLVEQVMSGALAVGEERLERVKITVLGIEVTGLEALAEQLEPEDLSETMNELLRAMSAAAVAHSGTVDRLSAGGVTILFGAPAAMPPAEQALAAVRTAFTIQQRLRELSTAWRRRGAGVSPEMRAAMQTGFCTVGVFGSEVLSSYTAVGTPVTVASLLLEDIPAGTIVCGPQTAALLEESGEFLLVPRGARTLRGLARPVESYDLRSSESVDEQRSIAALPRLRDFSFMPR